MDTVQAEQDTAMLFVGDRIIGVFSAALELSNGKGHALPLSPSLADPAFAVWSLGWRVRDKWQQNRDAAPRDVPSRRQGH